jgi:hypothetical protein
MPLVRLIYASAVTDACDLKGLKEILKIAREHNRKEGVTGVLCYDPQYFLQWLEGPRDKVNQLYTVILKDPRHAAVTILDYREVHHRVFEDWSMAYVSTRKMDQRILFKYAAGNRFDPFALTAEGARAFLIEISQASHEFLDQAVSAQDFS